MNKYGECLQFISQNFASFLDKPFIYEKNAFLALKLGKNNLAVENILKALERNSENLIYYLYFFMANGIKANLEKMNDLMLLSPSDKQLGIKLLAELRGKKVKSRISERIELILASGEEFKLEICSYITHNIKQNIPSILNAIKSVYDHQKEKVTVITEIITSHIDSIRSNNCLNIDYTNNERLDLMTQISWLYYFAAMHFDYLRDLEKAMEYINISIDITPSVNEFYQLKSKILKHAGMLKESTDAYEKVKHSQINSLTKLGQKIGCWR